MYSQETRLYITIIAAAAILGAFIIFFAFSIVRYKQKKIALHYDKLVVEALVLEKERARIANDLHDEFSPLVATMKIYLELLQDGSDDAMIAKIEGNINAIMQKIRDISHDLMPIVLQRKGFVAALKDHIELLHSTKAIQVKLIQPIALPIIPKDIELQLYRLTLEIMTNTLKHAHATVIEITIQHKKGVLHITISDNGIGFDKMMIYRDANGIGLQSITARIGLLKGSASLKASPNEGTSYHIELPL